MDFYKRTLNIRDFITLPGLVENNFTGSTETLPLYVTVMLTQKIEDLGIYEDVEEEGDKL